MMFLTEIQAIQRVLLDAQHRGAQGVALPTRDLDRLVMHVFELREALREARRQADTLMPPEPPTQQAREGEGEKP